MFGLSLDEIDAGIVTGEVNGAVRVGGEAAGEGGKVRESGGERTFERENKVGEGTGRRG